MAIDITTIGIEYDTSGLVRGTRAQNAATDSANKLYGALLAVTGALGVSQILDQVDAYTKYTAQLKLATGSTQEYAASLNIVRQISRDSQAALAGTGMLYARIANGTRELGVAQSQVAKITEVVNLGLKVSGATANEAASAQLQLSQAFASGTLRGEEFNAVNEAAPRLMKALADGIGVPVGALKEMASNGLITSEIMSRVLPASLEKLREEAKQVQTISGAMQVLKNNTLEFIGVQAQANGVVSIVTGAIGLLADNLGILAGAIITVTVTKLSNFMASLVTSTYATIAANRALAASNLETTTTNVTATASTLALAEARVIELRQAVLSASGATALAITLNGLIPAQTRAAAASVAHAEALAAQTVAAGAASTSAGVLRGALAFLGGPIGAIVAVLGVAATAWFVWGNKAKEANETATESTIAAADTIIKKLDAQIDRNKTIIELRKQGMSLEDAGKVDLAQLKTIKDINAELLNLDKNRASVASKEKEYLNTLKQSAANMRDVDGTRLLRNLDEQNKLIENEKKYQKDRKNLIDKSAEILKKDAEKNSTAVIAGAISTNEKLKKWLDQNGSAAQRMAAAMAEAKKEVGVLTPEMEKLIKAKFADKAIAKEAAFEESARHKMFMAHVKAEQSIQDQINKDAKQFASDQISRTKEVTKEIIAGINEQSKAFLSYNKSLDDHAQRMSDMNTLAQLEIDTLGMSSVQRNTLIEQKKIELALNRELLAIEELKTDQASKNILIDKAKSQANIDKSTAELRAQQGEWSKFYGEIYNGLSDSLYRGFEAGKGFGQSFIDSLKNMLKTNILKVSVQAVMDTGMNFLSGGSKDGGTSGGGLSSILSMFGGGGSSSAGGAASMIKGLGSTIGIATAMYGIGRAIAGDYKIGGMNSTFSTLIGGGVGARLFGMADKQLGGQTVTGNLGTNDLMRNQAWTQSGGLLRSDRAGTWSYGLSNSIATTSDGKSYTDTASLSSDKQLLQLLNDNYANVKSVTADLAKTLGLSAESIATRTDSLNLTLGKTQEETNAAISKVFSDIANSIATSLSPSLSSFAKTGESAADTLERLAGSLVDVNLVLGQAGFAKFAQTLEGGNAAARLAELTGGIENLASGTQFFVDNFLNDAEKIKPSIESVSATMARLGQSSVDTIPEFKSLVQGLDLTTESGAKMYAELIAIAPQFKAVADYMGQATVAIEDNSAALQKAKEIADERKSLQDEYNSLTMSSNELFEIYKNSLDVSNQSLAQSIQAIKYKTAAEEAAAAKAASIAAERKTLQDEYNQLTMTAVELMSQYRNGLDESNKALFDQIEGIKAARDKTLADQKAASDALLAAQKEADSIAAERISLQDEYNRMTMTEIELMNLKRSTLSESNRDLFDLIQAEKEKSRIQKQVADSQAEYLRIESENQRKLKEDQSNWISELNKSFNFESSQFKSVIDEFSNLSKTFKDYLKTLQTGKEALLSPEEQYNKSKIEFDKTLALVKSGDKNALKEFQNISEIFRSASMDNFASSEAYFADLEKIKSGITDASMYADAQVDVAKLQLNLLEQQVSGILDLNETVKTVSELLMQQFGYKKTSGISGNELITGYGANVLQGVENLGGKDALLSGAASGDPYGRRNLQLQLQRWNSMGFKESDMDMILGKGWINKFTEAVGIPSGLFGDQAKFITYIAENMQKIPGFANGGAASGLAIVGERGPELIDFKTPARVYNNNDTLSMSRNDNAETVELLKEQNKLLRNLLDQAKVNDSKKIASLINVERKIGNIKANTEFERSRA